VREAVSRDLGRAIKIGWERSDRGVNGCGRRRSSPRAVKLPELGQARARVVPGSPGLGREGENDTANSVVGK
jgi:hypothetical protein